jgi:hypothetical protein
MRPNKGSRGAPSGLAQGEVKLPVIGMLVTHAPVTDEALFAPFRDSLGALGYEDGRSVTWRIVSAESRLDKIGRAGAARGDAPVGMHGRSAVRPDLICRTAVYVTRSYGGVGGGGREAFPYPKWAP